MAEQNKITKRNFGYFIPLILIGLGLIIIGFVVIKLISYKNSNTGSSVTPAEVSYPAPELTLNSLHGEKVSISDYLNQTLLINNWAVWCPPCKYEMPTLEKYFEEHRDHGFMLVGIEAGDPHDQVASFVDEYGLTFEILLDPNERAMSLFKNDNLPSSYVIDRNGMVVLAWTGPISHAMLEKYVTPLLEQ